MDFGNFLRGLIGRFTQPQPQPQQQQSNLIGDPSQMKITYGRTPQFVPPTYAQESSPSTQFSQGLGRNPDIFKKPLTEPVKNAIQGAAKEFGVPQDLMFDVAYPEGGFRADAKNETPEGKAVGVPEGLYQFTPGTWGSDLANYAKSTKTSFNNFNPNMSRSDPVANARAAAYLISHGQLGRWEASMPNWGRFYSPEELNKYFSQTPNWKGTNSYYKK